MPLTKDQKKEILDKLIQDMKQAKSIVFADYQGMSVQEVKNLRAQMREKGVNFVVAKKTLLNIASKESGFGEIPNEAIEGPVGAAFGMEDEISPARIIHQLGKKNKNLKLRGALFDGRVLSVEETKALAELPSLEELIGKFMYLIKYPVQGFHGVLNNTVAGFVRALNAIREQKETTV
jgi:large subunit ribosomal protein L10